MTLDKKQIWVIFKFEFKMGHKVVDTTHNSNNAFGPVTANEHKVKWWFKKFCKGNKSLEDEEWPAIGSWQQPIERIIEADPLRTTWEDAEELNINNSKVTYHVKQIGKVKKIQKWEPHVVVFRSAQSCPTLCDPMDHSTAGIPVFHHLPEFAQTHVCWTDDAIQPSHPLHPLLLLPSIFSSIRGFSNESALCIRWPKYWSFSISPFSEYSGLIFLQDWLVWSPCSPRDSQESSPASFKSINSSALSLLYSPTLTSIQDYWKNHTFDYMDLCQQWYLCCLIHCLGLS